MIISIISIYYNWTCDFKKIKIIHWLFSK